jgi:hypothetical protein
VVQRSVRFLATHPTRRVGANWAIWAIVVVVVIAIGSGNSGSKPKQTAGRGQLTSGAAAQPSASPAPATGVDASSPTSAPSSTLTASLSAAAPAADNGGDVINGGVVLPNRRRTPGAINPAVTPANIASTICVAGWTATIRPSSSYTTGLKVQQLSTGYAYHGDTHTSDYEEDHLISLELGGSATSPKNLWPEPYAATDGARVKDRIENKLHELVCARQISLVTAQHAIAGNWYAAYQHYQGTTVSTAPHTTRPATTPPPVNNADPPAGATGICNDGTYSNAQHHQGMCSHHGGVRQFLT